MHIRPSVQIWYLLLLLCGAASTPIWAAEEPRSPASEQVFSAQELDQMLAPLALYPDSLLAQVLMAATYPGDVADAASWSKQHPDASGDAAVRQVSEQPGTPACNRWWPFLPCWPPWARTRPGYRRSATPSWPNRTR